MGKTFQKLTALAIAVLMLISLAACGSSTSKDTGTAQTKQETTAVTEAKTTEPPEPVTLEMWHLWTSEGDGNKVPFENALKHAGEQFKDIKLEVDGTDAESFKIKIKTAIAANEAPDIFPTWAAGFSKPFVDAGKVLALDEYLDDVKDKIVGGSLTNLTYGGKVYGIPFTMSVAALFCNKEIFDSNNLKIPETYDELLAVSKALNAKGITPMVAGAKDMWPVMFYYDVLALRTAGAKLCNDALGKTASFNQPEFIEAAAKLEELSKAGAFGKGSMSLSWDEAQVLFSQGKAAMIFNGSWVAGLCEGEDSKVKGKIVAAKFPVISGGKGTADEYFGGAADGFMISANTKNKDAAVKTMKFIAEDMCREAYLAGTGLPTWKVDVDESKINPLISQIAEQTKTATGFVLWWDVFLEGADADVHKNLVTEVFGGKTGPEKFAEEMQKLNEK